MSRYNRTKKKKDRKRVASPKPSAKDKEKEKEAPKETISKGPAPSKISRAKTSSPPPKVSRSTRSPTPPKSTRTTKRSTPSKITRTTKARTSSKITRTTKRTASSKQTPISKTTTLTPSRSRKRTITPTSIPSHTKQAQPESTEKALGKRDFTSKLGGQPSSSTITPSLGLKAGDVLEKVIVDAEEEDFYSDKIGATEKEVPTVPPLIRTDSKGRFNFTIDSDQDIKFFLEAYKVESASQGIQSLASPYGTQKQPQQQPSEIELKLLFSTKDSYEGSWSNKKVSLKRKSNYKEFLEMLEKKGINLECEAEDTSEAEFKFFERVALQSEKDLIEENTFTNFKSQLNLNLPPIFENPVLIPKTEVIATHPIDLSDDVAPKFNVQSLTQVLRNKLSNVITLNKGIMLNEDLDPIMAAPKINESMYTPLKKISLDYVLPGVGDIENNTAFLMAENRRFIESFMAGLNHEMNRELVWREFPTDKRGTVFTYFWDPACLEADEDGELVPPQDIDEIHSWREELGQNISSGAKGNASNIVIVIKGDVIRRYPDLIIYALKSPSSITSEDQFNSTSMQMIQPVFRSQLGADIIAMGFPISKEDLNLEGTSGDAGQYYFVLQEQQDLPVFGFDVRAAEGSTDLNWEDIEGGESLRNGYIDDFAEILGNDPNSANIATATMQVPVRVVIHAKYLIEGAPINNS